MTNGNQDNYNDGDNPTYVGLTCHSKIVEEFDFNSLKDEEGRIRETPRQAPTHRLQGIKKGVPSAPERNDKGNKKSMPEDLIPEEQVEWIIARINEVDEVIGEISTSMKGTKRNNPDDYKDLPWYCKARDKRNYLLAEKGRLINLLSSVRSSMEEDYVKSFAEVFLRKAEEQLPPKAFSVLVKITNDVIESSKT